MRKILILSLAAAGLSLLGAGTNPAQATQYPWCAQYTGNIAQSMSCGFVTKAQCMESIHGVGGFCRVNPWFLARESYHRARY